MATSSAAPTANGASLQAAGSISMPAFLQKSKAGKIHASFVDLEWAQRNRLVQGLQATEPPSQWARPTGEEVLKRNRYLNIDPYLSNRVRLRVPEGYNDYINASPICLKSSRTGIVKKYIATQGPKETSTGHFWRMVWHETGPVAVIVMLTPTHETTGREKCFQYFPADALHGTVEVNAHDEFEDGFRATVKLLEVTHDEKTRLTVRKLSLTAGSGESKTVWHLLFDAWPDFLIPEGEDRLALLQVIRQSVYKNSGPANPPIVHCSAGVGRSGTFIALDYLLAELADGALDRVPGNEDRISQLVDTLRQQRMMMVQGEAQFHFLYAMIKQKWVERNAQQGYAAAQDPRKRIISSGDVGIT